MPLLDSLGYIEVAGADLRNGLLTVALTRPKAESVVRNVEIRSGDNNSANGTGRRSGEGGRS